MATHSISVRRTASSRNSSNGAAVLDQPESIKHSGDRLQAEMQRLAEATQEGRLSERGRVHEFEGTDRKVVEGVNRILDAMSEPLKVVAENVAQISKGSIPAKITTDYIGDFGVIKNNLNACIDALGGLSESDAVLQKMAVNDYGQVVEGHYEGIFATIAEAINTVHKRFTHVESTLKDVARGDLHELPDYKKIARRSEGDELVPSIIAMMENIKALVEDVKMLGTASIEGKLTTRADASKHQGDFRTVVEGMNRTVDTLVNHLNAVPS
ncbi:MAG: hypothetical protein WBQ94_05560, partial [Terracidiphilus sp.]